MLNFKVRNQNKHNQWHLKLKKIVQLSAILGLAKILCELSENVI